MLGEFDKKKFATLLKKAVGQPARGINEYGRQSGVSGSYISRFLYPLSRPEQKWVKVPPGAEVIKKLANKVTDWEPEDISRQYDKRKLVTPMKEDILDIENKLLYENWQFIDQEKWLNLNNLNL